MSLRHLLQAAARQFDEEDASAFNLWSWCPSQASAREHWGDYACERQPALVDLWHEVTMLLSNFNGSEHSRDEIVEWFYINTDDLSEPPSEDEKLDFIAKWFAQRGWALHIKS